MHDRDFELVVTRGPFVWIRRHRDFSKTLINQATEVELCLVQWLPHLLLPLVQLYEELKRLGLVLSR